MTHAVNRCSSKSLLVMLIAAVGLVCGMIAPQAFATEFELSRIAREINFASSYLAKEVKYSRGFGGVGQRADRLARESADLVDAIRRNRSPSTVRSRFNDVSRRYADLENVFLRAYQNHSDDFVFYQVNLISDLYSELSNVYYFTHYYVNQPRVLTFINPQGGNFVAPSLGGIYQGNSNHRGNRDEKRRVIPARRNEEHRNRIRQRLDDRDQQHQSNQQFIRKPDTTVIETRRRDRFDQP